MGEFLISLVRACPKGDAELNVLFTATAKILRESVKISELKTREINNFFWGYCSWPFKEDSSALVTPLLDDLQNELLARVKTLPNEDLSQFMHSCAVASKTYNREPPNEKFLSELMERVENGKINFTTDLQIAYSLLRFENNDFYSKFLDAAISDLVKNREKVL
jgi:hypothetical protein